MPNVFLLDSFSGEYACLNEEECAHLRSVRVRENEVINVTDGKGKLFECIVTKINKKTADLKILKIKNIHCSFLPEINLFIGASKWDRMQILIEKAVEHRVSSIFVFNGEKSTFKYDDQKKFLKLIAESSKQSFLCNFPKFSFINIKDIPLKNTLVFDFQGTSSLKEELKKKLNSVNIVFGPDTGFSQNEKKFFHETFFSVVNLGNTVFRFETAALYVLSSINYEYERLLKNYPLE